MMEVMPQEVWMGGGSAWHLLTDGHKYTRLIDGCACTLFQLSRNISSLNAPS